MLKRVSDLRLNLLKRFYRFRFMLTDTQHKGTVAIDTLKHDKATQQAKAQADKLLTDLKAGKQDALTAAGLTLSASKTVDRNGLKAVCATGSCALRSTVLLALSVRPAAVSASCLPAFRSVSSLSA